MEEALDGGWMGIGEIEKIEVLEVPFPEGADYRSHPPTLRVWFTKYDEAAEEKARQELLNKLKGPTMWDVYKKAERAALERQKDRPVIQVKTRSASGTVKYILNGGYVDVNQYVYALGSVSVASLIKDGGILGEGFTAQSLKPVYDTACRFGENAEDTLLAWTDEDGLWVVGAAVFRSGSADINKKFANVAQTLPKGAHPPEGIANIVASIKGLTGVYEDVEGANLNLAVADFGELERWAGRMYRDLKQEGRTDLPWAALPNDVARFVADQIVALRRHTTFGVEHLKTGGDGKVLHEALIDTVQAMLSSKATLVTWMPQHAAALGVKV
jgi:hypothetical protein